MIKIKTHRFQNELWGRAHLPFFKKFDNYLKNFFDVESINYNFDGNTFSGRIQLSSDDPFLGNTPSISDVETVIENTITGELKIISFTEYFNHYVCHFAKSKICTTALLSHFNWHHLYYWMKRENCVENMNKVHPWIFLPFQEYDVLYYRSKKCNSSEYNEKLFWLGSGIDGYRKILRCLEHRMCMQELNTLPHDLYMEKMAKSKVGLSYYMDLNKYTTPFDHPGEFCYRDIEYISIGLPFIRIEYKDSLFDPLIPNKHYIAIPREHAYCEYQKAGDDGLAELFFEKFNEIKNDQPFLNYISKNQIEWYDRNLLNNKPYELTFKLLGLEQWI